jgi:hypothetical protein
MEAYTSCSLLGGMDALGPATVVLARLSNSRIEFFDVPTQLSKRSQCRAALEAAWTFAGNVKPLSEKQYRVVLNKDLVWYGDTDSGQASFVVFIDSLCVSAKLVAGKRKHPITEHIDLDLVLYNTATTASFLVGPSETSKLVTMANSEQNPIKSTEERKELIRMIQRTFDDGDDQKKSMAALYIDQMSFTKYARRATIVCDVGSDLEVMRTLATNRVLACVKPELWESAFGYRDPAYDRVTALNGTVLPPDVYTYVPIFDRPTHIYHATSLELGSDGVDVERLFDGIPFREYDTNEDNERVNAEPYNGADVKDGHVVDEGVTKAIQTYTVILMRILEFAQTLKKIETVVMPLLGSKHDGGFPYGGHEGMVMQVWLDVLRVKEQYPSIQLVLAGPEAMLFPETYGVETSVADLIRGRGYEFDRRKTMYVLDCRPYDLPGDRELGGIPETWLFGWPTTNPYLNDRIVRV